MPLYQTSHIGLEKIKYLFIDGGCLESVLEIFSRELFGGQKIEINYSRLAEGYQKVFYYDCLPVKKNNENESDYHNRIKPKIRLFNHLKSLNKFHVYEGTARFRDKHRGQEQKQVDIMIAVDMLTHSFRRNMHEATLLTGDLDFKPLIDALVQEGMYVELWYPKGRANYELVDAADSKQTLSIDTIKQWFVDSFKSKIKLPEIRQNKSINLSTEWVEVEKVKVTQYEAFFYENQGRYISAVPKIEGGYYLIQHNDLSQLKFYVDHCFGLDVLRQESF